MSPWDTIKRVLPGIVARLESEERPVDAVREHAHAVLGGRERFETVLTVIEASAHLMRSPNRLGNIGECVDQCIAESGLTLTAPERRVVTLAATRALLAWEREGL